MGKTGQYENFKIMSDSHWTKDCFWNPGLCELAPSPLLPVAFRYLAFLYFLVRHVIPRAKTMENQALTDDSMTISTSQPHW
jgi:hypothetical protein